MAHDKTQRGFTLIEGMAALTIMLVGAVGLIGLQTAGLRVNGDARRITRATAIAQDLLNQIETWPYTDARLSNANTANDGDVGDAAFAFETTAAPPSDHGEADLGSTYHGIAAVDGYERYWNVSDKDPANSAALLDFNGNGVADGIRIAVVVRWPHAGGWRRVVLLGFKRNPADVQ